MLKEMQYVIESSLFQQVLIEANIGNMAMHSFFTIMLFQKITIVSFCGWTNQTSISN